MTAPLLELEPSLVWKHFDEIRKIPRGSGKEDRAVAYVLSVAERLGLEARRDEVGNVLIDVPATVGRDSARTVVLQGHLDMVNEKNADTEHDFDRDPIDAFVDGEWVRARGTTLGSDNGIGVAMALAVAEDADLEHGPLELLFTLDEETGMTGALGLGGDFVKGRTLINLDTEEENSIYIGCAGGVDLVIERPIAREEAGAGTTAREIRIAGLKGGHSGVDIHEQRGNANRLLARALDVALGVVPCRLGDVRGGNLRNAIPREATAVLVLPEDAVETLAEALEREARAISKELERVDRDVRMDLSEVAFPPETRVLPAEETRAVVDFLNALPHGVEAWSSAVPGLVETSTNFATVRMEAERLDVTLLSRGSVASSLDAMNRRIHSLVRLAGATSREEGAYPGWTPDPGSELVRTAMRVHERILGVKPKTKAIHAGLECGVIGDRFPGMEMVSLGPRIEGAHSPDEKVYVPAVERSHAFLRALLEELAR